MILKQLQSFVIVYQTGSMVQAAKQLFISQPAISQQIRKLENELNVELFIHSKGRIAPTEYADLFYPYARHAIAELETGQAVLREKAKESNTLCVHIYFYNTITRIAQFLEEFGRDHPDITLKLQQSLPPKHFHTPKSFEKNTLYFADANWIDGTALSFSKLYDAHLLCLMRKDCPLAGRKALEACDLTQEIIYNPATPNTTLRPIFDSLSSPVPKENQRLSSSFLESTMNISAMGGVCIVPDYLSAPGGLVGVPYQPGFSYPVGFAYTGNLTKPMKLFLHEAKAFYTKAATP